MNQTSHAALFHVSETAWASDLIRSKSVSTGIQVTSSKWLVNAVFHYAIILTKRLEVVP